MTKVIKCSFCKRTASEVYKIITCKKVAICNACTTICTRVLMESPQGSVESVLAYEVKIDVRRSPEEIAEYFAVTGLERMG